MWFCQPVMAADHKHAPTGTYTDWNWPEAPRNPEGKIGYRSFSHRLVIERTPGNPEVGYFWAHQVAFVDGKDAYFGLQTLGERTDGTMGKVAIFSVWDALDARGPGFARRFGGEGVGFQTLIPYDWQVGKAYRLRLFKSGESRKGTEWTAMVREESSGDEVTIGTITVPKKWGYLGNWSVMWSERYTGPEIRTCRDVGYARVWFEEPSANDGGLKPDQHGNYLSDPVNCPNSRVVDRGNGTCQEMGMPK